VLSGPQYSVAGFLSLTAHFIPALLIRVLPLPALVMEAEMNLQFNLASA
jgi:hypothetical protein